MYNLSSYLTLRFDYNSNWTSKTGLNSIKVYNEQDTLENLIKILKKLKNNTLIN